MTGDALLAVMGVSAGVGSAVGAWAALWYRNRVAWTDRQLVRWIYKHVDDLIGATKTENQTRAGKRFRLYRRLWFLPKKVRVDIANFFWPTPQLGTGTAALPSVKRMGAYVRLGFSRPSRLGRRRRLWEVGQVAVFWTSEAPALSGDLPKNVGRKVAQALRLESVDQLEWTVDYDLGCIRYERKGPIPEFQPRVPMGVNADA